MKWKSDLIKDIRYNDYRDDLDWNGGDLGWQKVKKLLHPNSGFLQPAHLNIMTLKICICPNGNSYN
jgi:hypothetical protein